MIRGEVKGMFVDSGEYYSWTVIDDDTAIKHMDKSSFEHHGSGIPKGMVGFFDRFDMKPGDRRDIVLRVRGERYDGHIECGSVNGNRYRIFWEMGLQSRIQDIFDYDFVKFSGDYPYMTFNRIDDTEFEVFFSDGKTVELESDEEYYSGHPIDDDLFERLVARKSDRELEVIIGEISMDNMIPVEKKVTFAKRIIRDRAIASYVKERAGYRCEICGVQGFFKEGGGKYAEAHHLLELGRMKEDSLFEHPDFMICVCPTCHRVIHYGAGFELKSRLGHNV